VTSPPFTTSCWRTRNGLAEMVAVSQLGAGIVELEGHAELFSEFPAASS